MTLLLTVIGFFVVREFRRRDQREEAFEDRIEKITEAWNAWRSGIVRDSGELKESILAQIRSLSMTVQRQEVDAAKVAVKVEELAGRVERDWREKTDPGIRIPPELRGPRRGRGGGGSGGSGSEG